MTLFVKTKYVLQTSKPKIYVILSSTGEGFGN